MAAGRVGSSDRRGSLKPLPDRINVAAGTQLKKSRLTKAIQLVERSASLQPPEGRSFPDRLSPSAWGRMPTRRSLPSGIMGSWKFPRTPPA